MSWDCMARLVSAITSKVKPSSLTVVASWPSSWSDGAELLEFDPPLLDNDDIVLGTVLPML